MKEKPFEILNVKPRIKNEDKDYINSFEHIENIYTPFGTVKPLTFSNKILNNKALEKVWNLFFFRFINKVREEMKNGMTEILLNINSFSNCDRINEMPTIAAFSGNNGSDHLIIFGILEEFLNISNKVNTIVLDYENMDIEGLNSSKILDNIWFQIKHKYLDTLLSDIEFSTFFKELSNNDPILHITKERKIIDSYSKFSESRDLNETKKNKRSCTEKKNENIPKNNYQIDINYWKLERLEYRLKWIKSPINLISNGNTNISSFLKFNLNKRNLDNLSKGLKKLKTIYKIRRRNKLQLKPMVLLLPNAEFYPNGQLESLFELIYQIKESYKIPFIIILGISTNLVYLQQIISQINTRKLQMISIKLLDSKKVFFQSILSQFIFDFENLIFETNDLSNNENALSENNTNPILSQLIIKEFKELLLIPFIPCKFLRLIKDNFFQNDYSLNSAIRTIFIIFQSHFTYNDFEFLNQSNKVELEEVFNQNIESNLECNFKYDSNYSNTIETDLEIIPKLELYQRKQDVVKIRFGMYIVNILMLEILSFFDINQRYNQLIEWVELIQTNSMDKLDYKIKNFRNSLLNSNKSNSFINDIFNELNHISKTFILNMSSKFNYAKVVFSVDLDYWDIENVATNLMKLLRPIKKHELCEKLNFKIKSRNHLFTKSIYNTQLIDSYLDEILAPSYTFNILKELSGNEDLVTDYSVVYRIYESCSEQKINLYQLFVSFCNLVYKDINSKTYPIGKSENKLENNSLFMEKIGENLEFQYKKLVERFVKVLNTFQLIGLIYLPTKIVRNDNIDKSLLLKEERVENNSRVCESNEKKKMFDYIKRLFGGISVHKLHWDFNGINLYKDPNLINHKETQSITNDDEENMSLKKNNFSKGQNSESNSTIRIKGSKYHDDSRINSKSKKRLEVIRQRAAEMNQTKVSKFKDMRRQKNINSINLINQSRDSNSKIKF